MTYQQKDSQREQRRARRARGQAEAERRYMIGERRREQAEQAEGRESARGSR